MIGKNVSFLVGGQPCVGLVLDSYQLGSKTMYTIQSEAGQYGYICRFKDEITLNPSALCLKQG